MEWPYLQEILVSTDIMNMSSTRSEEAPASSSQVERDRRIFLEDRKQRAEAVKRKAAEPLTHDQSQWWAAIVYLCYLRQR